MNWLQKIASVTFSIADSYKISQPRTIFYIASYMNYWAHDNVPKELCADVPEIIALDGLEDIDKPTGGINWYYKEDSEESRRYIEMYIKQYEQEELIPLGINFSPEIKFETSKMYKTPVARIRVVKNDTFQRDRLPELNVSNQNASALLKLLGIRSEPSGSIDASELLSRILENRDKVDSYTRFDRTEVEPGKNTNIMFGLSRDQLIQYLNILEKMTDKAFWMNNSTITWG